MVNSKIMMWDWEGGEGIGFSSYDSPRFTSKQEREPKKDFSQNGVKDLMPKVENIGSLVAFTFWVRNLFLLDFETFEYWVDPIITYHVKVILNVLPTTSPIQLCGNLLSLSLYPFLAFGYPLHLLFSQLLTSFDRFYPGSSSSSRLESSSLNSLTMNSVWILWLDTAPYI